MRRGRFIELSFLGLILLGAAYFGLQWILEAMVHSRPERVVPDLKGKSAVTALHLLGNLNLALKKDGEEFDTTVPAGAILRQFPVPGTTVREGRVIRAVLSQGSETVFMPSLVGLPLRNAEMLLKERQVQLGEISQAFSLSF